MPQKPGTTVRAAKRQRSTVWQILFGQGSNRLPRRSPLQQTQKNFKVARVDPPRHFLQRLKRSEPHLTTDQAAAKLAADQVRQAVLGRSRQFNGSSSTASATPHRGRRNAGQETRVSAQFGSLATAQASPQGKQERGQEQASPLAQRRKARQRTHRVPTKHPPGLGIAESTPGTALKMRSNAPMRQQDRDARPRSRSVSAGLYAARMLILSVGIGVLVGTMLSMLDPASRVSAGASQQATKKANPVGTEATQVATTQSLPTDASTALLPKTGQELIALKAALQTLALQSPEFTPGIFLFDLDTNAYLDLNGDASFAAASTIKVPILVAFFQDVDAGKIRLDDRLTIQKESVAGGSGELQGLPVGTQLTALETVTKMITISDNTATNIVIARLGGMAALDQRFRSWGLVSTALNNLLPDLNGTNTTSPKEMASLMTRISQGELVSMRSRDRLLDIMQRTVNRSQLAQGLDKGATIAHKTGDIGGLIGDVGLIDMPNGKRYSLTILVKRAFNDDRAYELVQKASRTVYQYFNRVPAIQRSAVSPSTPSESLPGADKSAPATPDRAPSIPVDTAITQSPSLDRATR